MSISQFLIDRFVYVYEGSLEFTDTDQAVENFKNKINSILPSNIIEAKVFYKDHFTISYEYDIVKKELTGVRTWTDISLRKERAALVSPYAYLIPDWRRID